MKLENRFTVDAPRAQALTVLLDVERIAPCMPGATLTSRDGEDFTGTVKVKVGPINLTYGGQARFVSIDEAAGVVVVEASGKETRGTGTAKALVTCRLIDKGSSTDVEVDTDLAITGKPAQFGRGVLADVSAKLVGQFAACLGKEILAGAPTAAAADPSAASADQPAAPSAPSSWAPSSSSSPPAPRPVRAAEPIDLLGTAGAPVLKRLAPVVVALVVLLLVVRRLRR
ncbi:MAG: SRPBCC family protein [Mycobacteriales bacterium]